MSRVWFVKGMKEAGKLSHDSGDGLDWFPLQERTYG